MERRAPRGRPLILPFATAALVAAPVVTLAWAAPVPLASASTGPPLPAPAVRDLSPRVNDLTPRVIDVRPAVSQTPSATSITVSSDVLFAFGRSDLSPLAQSVLGDVVNKLNAASPGVVTVTGYTDSVGADDYNLALSRARAQAVQAYLASKVTQPGLTYQVVGKGKADPVAPNTNPDGTDNPDGRRQNRRVTVQFAVKPGG